MAALGVEYFAPLLAVLALLVILLARHFAARCVRGVVFSVRLLAFLAVKFVRALKRGDYAPAAALVKRELLTSLRLRRTYALLVVSVGAVFAVMLANVPALVGAQAPQAQLAVALFGMYAGTLAMVGYIFVPLLAAPAISTEHQRHTIEMLAVTLIRPRTIVMAKLVNVLGVFFLIVVATMPVVGVLLFFTGISLWHFAFTLIATMLKFFTAASIGLMCSAVFHRNTVAAIGATYLLLLALLAIFPWFALFAAFICLTRTPKFVQRPPSLPQLEMPALIRDAGVLRERRTQWPFYLIDPMRPLKPIPDRSNPMFAKENRTGPLRRGSWRIRIFYVYMILFIFIPFFSLESGWARSGDAELWRTLYIETMLILLLTPAAISTSFSKEYEIGHLDMLRMTTLRPRQIVMGKVLSSAAMIAPLVLASVAGVVLTMPSTGAQNQLLSLAMGYGSMVATLLFALSVGAIVSVFSRQTAVALVGGYALNIALLLGVPQLGGRVLPGDSMVTIPMPLSLLMHASEYGMDAADNLRPWLINLVSSMAFTGLLLAACVMVFSRRWMHDT